MLCKLRKEALGKIKTEGGSLIKTSHQTKIGGSSRLRGLEVQIREYSIYKMQMLKLSFKGSLLAKVSRKLQLTIHLYLKVTFKNGGKIFGTLEQVGQSISGIVYSQHVKKGQKLLRLSFWLPT